MKSYRSSWTFVTIDLLFHKLLPFDQNSFSRLFSSMLLHFWMKVGNKLLFEELQIKLDFCQDWLTFSRVIALCLKFVFLDFSRLCFHIPEWKLVGSFHMKSYRSSSTFVMFDLLFYELLPFVQNSFSRLFVAIHSFIFEWKLVGSFHMKSYRSSFTFVTVDLFLLMIFCHFLKKRFPRFPFRLSSAWRVTHQVWSIR